MKESNIMKLVQIRASQLGMRLMRNNSAKGWVGQASVSGSMVVIPDARRLHAGLGIGTGDLIGWTPVQVTDEMVGSTVAVFTNVEVKTPKGVITPEQKQFHDTVIKAGGISQIVRSPEQLLLLPHK